LYIFLFFPLPSSALSKKQTTQPAEGENLSPHLLYLGQGTEYIFGALIRNLCLRRLRE